MTKHQKENLINEFFQDPSTIKMINKEIGQDSNIVVNWNDNTVRVSGSIGSRQWNLDEMLLTLRSLSKARESILIH